MKFQPVMMAFLLGLWFSIGGVTAHAVSGSYDVNPITGLPVEPSAITQPTKDAIGELEPNELPSVSTEQLGGWIEKKGYEVIQTVQRFGQPFFIIVFLLALVKTIFSSLTGGKVGVSIGTMLFSLVGWVAMAYAVEIFVSFDQWITAFSFTFPSLK